MKFSALVSLLPAAAAAKGIHLRVNHEATDDVFHSVVDLMAQCPDETAALSECYAGYPAMLDCGECAWTRVLSEFNLNADCVDIDQIATADYQSCIDTSSSTCNDQCNVQATAAWNCAKALLCA